MDHRIHFNPNIAALPIYQSGFSAGVDVGLFIGRGRAPRRRAGS